MGLSFDRDDRFLGRFEVLDARAEVMLPVTRAYGGDAREKDLSYYCGATIYT